MAVPVIFFLGRADHALDGAIQRLFGASEGLERKWDSGTDNSVVLNHRDGRPVSLAELDESLPG